MHLVSVNTEQVYIQWLFSNNTKLVSFSIDCNITGILNVTCQLSAWFNFNLNFDNTCICKLTFLRFNLFCYNSLQSTSRFNLSLLNIFTVNTFCISFSADMLLLYFKLFLSVSFYCITNCKCFCYITVRCFASSKRNICVKSETFVSL